LSVSVHLHTFLAASCAGTAALAGCPAQPWHRPASASRAGTWSESWSESRS